MNGATLQRLPLAKILRPPQVREHFDEAEIEGLAQSMRETGLQQPVLVEPAGDEFSLIDGERRVRAALQLEWTEIPALVRERAGSTADTLQAQLVSACQRADLTPMETARAIQRLMKATEWSSAAVAAKLGLSPATVSKLLALLALQPELQELVHAGSLPASTAYEIAKVCDPAERRRLGEEAARGGMTRSAVVARVRSTQRGSRAERSRRPARAKRTRRFVARLEGGHLLTLTETGVTVAAVHQAIEAFSAKLRVLEEQGFGTSDAAQALAAEGH